MKKIKRMNIFGFKKFKKFIRVNKENTYLYVVAGIFIITGVIAGLAYSFALPEEIKEVVIDSDHYGDPGSYRVTKSASWIDSDTAKIRFDFDSIVNSNKFIARKFDININDKILDILKKTESPVILVLNKIDKINKEDLFQKILELKDLYDFLDIVPISSLKNNNVDELLKVIKKHLPDDIKYFSDDIITNVTEKFMVSEIIREKVLMLTKQEVPHAITCVVEEMDFKKESVYITALIIVDRENLKSIIIGKRGSMLTKIGSMARCDIEELLNKTQKEKTKEENKSTNTKSKNNKKK